MLASIAVLFPAILSILIFVLIGRKYGSEGVGLYGLYLTMLSLIGMITEFGVTISAVRFWYDKPRVVISIVYLRLAVLFCLIPIFAILYGVNYFEFEILLIPISFATIASLLSTAWFNQCEQDYQSALVIDGLVKSVFLLTIMVAVFLSFSVREIIIINAIGLIASSICLLFFNMGRITRLQLRYKDLSIEFIVDSFRTFGFRGSVRMNEWMTPLIISHYFGLGALGMYSVVDRIIKPLFNFQQPIINIFSRRLYGLQEKSLLNVFLYYNLAAGLLLALGFYLVYDDAFSLIGFDSGYSVRDFKLIIPFLLFTIISVMVFNNFCVLPSKKEGVAISANLTKLFLLLGLFQFEIIDELAELFLVIIIFDWLYIAFASSVIFLNRSDHNKC